MNTSMVNNAIQNNASTDVSVLIHEKKSCENLFNLSNIQIEVERLKNLNIFLDSMDIIPNALELELKTLRLELIESISFKLTFLGSTGDSLLKTQ
ncbi:hypothetical protein [Aliivibrio fischeri]|uniref:hypothetical protein n=1 Tax=Aliivibrio fischeri TaxID=668 RepID=UPI0006D15A22|nr:hypothetical protein [Aliivibrio fischeri]USR97223.1 hypothetical protein AVFI_18750 [Aliivibrio fischeri ATCC 7744 = JCM 18803 = DSM 507]GGK48915.1 hypothetical protein GCM10007987_35090 [Aliivibrio fischeri]